jgi:hypothetical protein
VELCREILKVYLSIHIRKSDRYIHDPCQSVLSRKCLEISHGHFLSSLVSSQVMWKDNLEWNIYIKKIIFQELSTRDLWHLSDIIIGELALNTAHYVIISQSHSHAQPHHRAVTLLQGVSKKWPDDKHPELMLFFEGYINLLNLQTQSYNLLHTVCRVA